MMDKNRDTVNVIGAGLAGCEAAWQIARHGIGVRLFEMKPHQYSPAHHSPNFAELVCSNSLRAEGLENAVGLLKREMAQLGSLVMEAAEKSRVPAGGALAVDREVFSGYITRKIGQCPQIGVICSEVSSGEGVHSAKEGNISIIATGPLTDGTMYESIKKLAGNTCLHFYDAAAPIVSFDSIDMDKVFFASRYDKGEASYINCPLTEAQYKLFHHELVHARRAKVKDFEENGSVFEGCMPVEVMAERGYQVLLFGPMKPVGIRDPRAPEGAPHPFAVAQLRRDDVGGSMYNLVGFQTHLAFEEQKRVFSMIPGLENAEFLRYGVMHRNTYINSPGLLNDRYEFIANEGLFFAGQITGVEGYAESASSGIVAGISAARRFLGLAPVSLTADTAIGALAAYISDTRIGQFQPMNINYGIIAPLSENVKGGKKVRRALMAERSAKAIESYIQAVFQQQF